MQKTVLFPVISNRKRRSKKATLSEDEKQQKKEESWQENESPGVKPSTMKEYKHGYTWFCGLCGSRQTVYKCRAVNKTSFESGLD